MKLLAACEALNSVLLAWAYRLDACPFCAAPWVGPRGGKAKAGNVKHADVCVWRDFIRALQDARKERGD